MAQPRVDRTKKKKGFTYLSGNRISTWNSVSTMPSGGTGLSPSSLGVAHQLGFCGDRVLEDTITKSLTTWIIILVTFFSEKRRNDDQLNPYLPFKYAWIFSSISCFRTIIVLTVPFKETSRHGLSQQGVWVSF